MFGEWFMSQLDYIVFLKDFEPMTTNKEAPGRLRQALVNLKSHILFVDGYISKPIAPKTVAAAKLEKWLADKPEKTFPFRVSDRT